MIQAIIDYLDGRFLKENIWYNLISKGTESKNISKFLAEQLLNTKLDELIIKNKWDKIVNEEKKIYYVMKWVIANLDYRSDSDNYHQIEYWATVDEIFEYMEDDCEGGAYLIVLLGRKLGIPRERLKLWCGDTPFGGHACAIYKSLKYPYTWFFMDWCYYLEMRLPGNSRRSYTFYDYLSVFPENDRYLKGWFIVDEEKGTRKTQ